MGLDDIERLLRTPDRTVSPEKRRFDDDAEAEQPIAEVEAPVGRALTGAPDAQLVVGQRDAEGP